jgi:hypothetical protein
MLLRIRRPGRGFRVPGLCALLLAAALAAPGCGPTVDLIEGLQVVDVTTGWHDAGIVDGKNKLVPSVEFRLRNVSDQPLVALQVNAIFRRVTEPDEEWGSGFLSVAGGDGLEPGATSDLITISSRLGYTGEDSRTDMLSHSQFVDAKVDVFAKYSSQQWKRIAEYAIERQLVVR